jgi:hypothetical protein
MVERFQNLRLFVKHVGDVSTLRKLAAEKGPGWQIFGGTALTSFEEVTALMVRNPEKVSWFYAPVELGDYYTAGYMPFQAHGADHLARRSAIVDKCAQAHAHLDEFEALLDSAPTTEIALARFWWNQMVGLEISDDEVDRLLDYRKWGAPLGLLPQSLRYSVFLVQTRRIQAHRQHFLDRLTAAEVPFHDSWWDVLWFQCATVSFYPQRVMEAVAERPEFLDVVTVERDNDPRQRPQTRALVMEIMRLFCKIASTNYDEGGDTKIALIPVACMDPKRYPNPESIDLDRDHSDALAFAASSPRGCPAHDVVPDMMAAIVAHAVRARQKTGSQAR